MRERRSTFCKNVHRKWTTLPLIRNLYVQQFGAELSCIPHANPFGSSTGLCICTKSAPPPSLRWNLYLQLCGAELPYFPHAYPPGSSVGLWSEWKFLWFTHFAHCYVRLLRSFSCTLIAFTILYAHSVHRSARSSRSLFYRLNHCLKTRRRQKNRSNHAGVGEVRNTIRARSVAFFVSIGTQLTGKDLFQSALLLRAGPHEPLSVPALTFLTVHHNPPIAMTEPSSNSMNFGREPSLHHLRLPPRPFDLPFLCTQRLLLEVIDRSGMKSRSFTIGFCARAERRSSV